MKAILLTAGFGSRLRPLTDVLPKCLLPVNGRPLLEYWFSMLINAGVTSILMNLHYLPQIMKEWVELTEYAQDVTMVYEESLLGTGGTLFQNRDFVGDKPVMLIHADNLCYTDITAYIDAHNNRPTGAEVTMMTFETSTPKTCGIVEIDSLGIVQAFHEKVINPPGNLANAAVYIIEPEIMDFLASLNKSFIDFSTGVLPAYMGKIHTWQNNSYHRDIGNIDSYLAAQIEYLQTAMACDKENAWSLLCQRNSDKLSGEIMTALSSALNAEVINSSELTNHSEQNLTTGNKMIIIHCLDTKNHLQSLLRYVEIERIERSNVIVFFKKVPFNFSSQKLYGETGLRSLALYSSEN